MTPLIWMLTWLSQVLPAISELPQPVNPTLNSVNFRTMLKWEPGPGTPTGVCYNVTYATDRGTSLLPVRGCECVRDPLVCNMTDVFYDPNETYLAQVTTWLGTQESQPATKPEFKLIRDSQLDLPLLNVEPRGMNLCVDLKLPNLYMSQNHRDIYNKRLKYRLKIESNSPRQVEEMMYPKNGIVKHVVPGRQYCVSVCFSDELEPKVSNYSQPVCVSIPGIFYPRTDLWILVALCLLVVFAVVIILFLFSTGFIYLSKRPLPLVLTSLPHIDVPVSAPSSLSLFSVLSIKATLPSSAETRLKQSSSDESDGESETESTARDYKLRVGANLLSSSSWSSSSSSAPLCPKPEPQPFLSSDQTSDLTETHSSSARSMHTDAHRVAHTDTHTVAHTDTHTDVHTDRHKDAHTDARTVAHTDTHTDVHTDRGAIETTMPNKEEEKEVVGEGGSLDVNLLTLTFGRHEEEEEDEEEEQGSHLDAAEVESGTLSVSEECSSTLVQPLDTREVAIEPVSCSAEEEDDEEEEEEEDDGYMGRPCTAVLQKLL